MPNTVQTCVAAPEIIPSDGSSASIITANVVDGILPVEGVQVTWAVLGPGVADVTSTTNTAGVATVSLTANAAGSITVTATTADDTTGQTATVTAQNDATDIVQSVEADPAAIPSDGSVSSVITALVTDSTTMAPLGGVAVTWEVTGAGDITPLTSTTDAEGKATTTLTATGPGLITIKATTVADQTGKSVVVVSTTPLAAPTVLNASPEDSYTLDIYDIEFGVTASVPSYTNAVAGHVVTFHWGDLSSQFDINDPDADLPRFIHINKELPPEALEDGVHNVYYDVLDQAGNISVSSGVEISVVNGGHTSPTLTAPSIPEAGDGYINIQEASNGVSVIISYPTMADGDFVTLYWPTLDSQDNPILAATTSLPHTVTGGETSFELTVPAEIFFPSDTLGYEGSVDAYYTVKTVDSSGVLKLSYNTHCRIDTLSP